MGCVCETECSGNFSFFKSPLWLKKSPQDCKCCFSGEVRMSFLTCGMTPPPEGSAGLVVKMAPRVVPPKTCFAFGPVSHGCVLAEKLVENQSQYSLCYQTLGYMENLVNRNLFLLPKWMEMPIKRLLLPEVKQAPQPSPQLIWQGFLSTPFYFIRAH